MASDFLPILTRSMLASSLAILVVLASRHLVRQAFGASISYALWLLVPVSFVAIILPRPAFLPMAITAVHGQPLFDLLAGEGTGSSTGIGVTRWLVLIWAAGALIALALTLIVQGRFLRRLGPLRQREDGCWQSQNDAFGPMLIGVFHPRIIVPLSFDRHYAVQERELILAHECVHHRRGDAQVNALVVLFRCLHWFNPLVHFAARAFRKDQEIACDARVIYQFPNARRSYADAMLKTQLIGSGLPIGCYWQSGQPIKERIAMFKKPLPGRWRKVLGSSVLGATLLATSCLVWVAQASEIGASFARMSPPAFPADLVDSDLEATLYLKVTVAVDGTPTEVVLDHVRPESLSQAVLDRLTASSVESIKTWAFHAAKRDGKVQQSSVLIPITFTSSRARTAVPTAAAQRSSMKSL